MLFKGNPRERIQDSTKMTVTHVPKMVLFQPEIVRHEKQRGWRAMTLTYRPPQDPVRISRTIPLMPDTTELKETEVSLHNSPTKAFIMQDDLNAWFSECFGYDVIFVYLGPYYRPVLGNLSPQASVRQSRSWMRSISGVLSSLYYGTQAEGLTFADVAPFLFVTEESHKEVSKKLPEGQDIDIRKFRPNIVLAGAGNAYDEDYWGALTVDRENGLGHPTMVNFILTANCARCVSINLDYSTGEPGKGEDGSILKKMMKDRRVDKGTKYSPIFGRYAFLSEDAQHSLSKISIGDEVKVSKRNIERTTFCEFETLCFPILELMSKSDWPGLSVT